MRTTRALLPKEHGAWGQIAFPLVTAFAVAGPSPAGVLLGAAVAAGFMAHEPAAVLLGLRGPRARRELSFAAIRWLIVCLPAGCVAAVTAAVVIQPAVRWSLAVPAVPAVFLAGAMIAGRERSWYGEIAAAVAFSGVAIPIALASGTPPDVALAVAVPFALLFVTTTLAVRVAVLRVRGGGDPYAVAVTRRATLTIAAAASVLIAIPTMTGQLGPSVLVSSAPGLVTAALVAARPPAPTRLRLLGWSLVAVSTLTAALVVATA